MDGITAMIRTPAPRFPTDVLDASPELKLAGSDYSWHFIDSDGVRPVLVPHPQGAGMPRTIPFAHRIVFFEQVAGGEVHSHIAIAIDHFDQRAYWCVISLESVRYTSESLSRDPALTAWNAALTESPPTS